MKRLRYILDRIASWIEPHCPDDWMDTHLDFGSCCRCERVAFRKSRIARFRNAKLLPKAQAL